MPKTSATQTQPPPRPRGRPPANREKLLAAARECLRDKGYAGTTARDLVEASGTNLASIGYHFGSKEALLNEAVGRDMAAWTASVEKEFFAEESASFAERLERALAAMIDRFDELEPYLVSFVEAFPPAVRSPELRAGMASAYREVRDAGRKMFVDALEEEGIPIENRDAEVLSSLVLAICDGLILQWLLDPESTPSSKEAMNALAALSRGLDP